MPRLASRLVVFLLLLAVVGCGQPDVVVVDAAGNPVAGATIVGTSLSIAGQTSKTDERGHASIPAAVQETRWISVEKTGFVSVTGVDVRQKKPIRILLQPDSGGPTPGGSQ